MTDDFQTPRHEEGGAFCVAALYHFARFPRFESFRAELDAVARENGIKGTLLLAAEGINGTIAGTNEGIAKILAFLRAQPEFAALVHKESRASKMPFLRMKVRLKKEIVTMGVENYRPQQRSSAPTSIRRTGTR